MSLLPDGRILIMGGYMAGKGVTKPEYYGDVRELDTETMVWSRPRVTGAYPKARTQHATCMMYVKKNYFFLILFFFVFVFLVLVFCFWFLIFLTLFFVVCSFIFEFL